MISVAVSGAAGRMGSLVAATVSATADLELVACFDPRGSGEAGGRAITADPADLSAADVVVEFTNPDVVMQNLAAWREMNLNAVVGTSGFDEARLAALEAQWGSGPPNCLIVPNFSIGAVLMMRFAEMAAPHFAVSEVIEAHHDRKVDAPSGTALATAAGIRAAGGRQERAVESVELVDGARGADAGGVRVHSVRLPGLIGYQEVLFGVDGEMLTIRHDTSDRVSFIPGVLLGVRAVSGLTSPVTVGLNSLLGL